MSCCKITPSFYVPSLNSFNKSRSYIRNVVKDVKDVPVPTPLVIVCAELVSPIIPPANERILRQVRDILDVCLAFETFFFFLIYTHK